MRQRWGVIGLVAMISFLSGGWLLQRGVAGAGNVYQQARLFDDVLGHVSAYYVDSLGETDLYQKATEGMLEQLQDPYSVLLTGDDYRALTEQTSGNYAGLGIQIDVRDGWITVVAPLPETPAERAGVQTGDQIIEVDGKSTEGWKNDEAVKALRGQAGSKITITVRRSGIPEPIKYTLTRAQIHIRSVPAGTLFDAGVGYISLNQVSETSAAELRQEIGTMMGKGMKSLILDLRLNPGGLLDQGVEVADLFLDSKQEIVSTRGRARGATKRFLDDARQTWPALPIVVLVNDGTASAAEIIAGALQDHDRAVVVGSPTFGKGLVQTLFPLGEGVALKLTTARWFTPSGRTIQREAKSEEEQAEVAALESSDTVLGAPEQENTDSALKERPIFHTDAGREVRGGGGIVPDIVVRPDTLSEGEREFAKELGGKLPQYRDVLTSIALEAKTSRSVTSESFKVTPEMRQDVYGRLKAKGATLTPATFQAAGKLIDEQLGYEVARYVFGRPAEFRRRAADDKPMQEAIGLLRKAQSPKELLSLAAASQPESPAPN
ncbi:MAG: S41 family peptidase [Gemmatimonadales bacterium]|nr:S41 family peptidase [Gemmatimonadales bacterium]MDQ3428011.1 S41 family peptidase [Gemmatimonadota bacterium]